MSDVASQQVKRKCQPPCRMIHFSRKRFDAWAVFSQAAASWNRNSATQGVQVPLRTHGQRRAVSRLLQSDSRQLGSRPLDCRVRHWMLLADGGRIRGARGARCSWRCPCCGYANREREILCSDVHCARDRMPIVSAVSHAAPPNGTAGTGGDGQPDRDECGELDAPDDSNS